MRQPYFTKSIALLVSLLAIGSHLLAQDSAPYEAVPSTPDQEEPEVLTSGPVHEAFAEPVELQLQDPLVIPAQPPAVIVENPPAERPAGEQFVWIPGYWAWDTDRNSFIWVSGCWRAAPQKMYWVPGYWAKTPDGWQWISGFWSPVAAAQQIEYLPPPPALEDVEPLGIQPSPDTIWIPPCWYWYQGQYIRRSGYWLTAQENWVWIPSHYVWTPRGYVFVKGYWDYQLNRRGVLFAPVYFPRPVYKRLGYSYSVRIVVDIDNLQFNLFTAPRYRHYYFGDYYDIHYVEAGIYPWFECERRHTWYDPIYQHNRWYSRKTDSHWEEHQRNHYDDRRANKDLRPPRTYREMEIRQAKMSPTQRKNMQMAEPLGTLTARKKTSLKFERIKDNKREGLSQHSTRVHQFREERSRWESPAADRKTSPPAAERKNTVTPPDRTDRADRVKIPDSPVVGKRSIWSTFKKGPPSRPADEQKTQARDSDTRKDRGRQNKK